MNKGLDRLSYFLAGCMADAQNERVGEEGFKLNGVGTQKINSFAIAETELVEKASFLHPRSVNKTS